MGGAAIGSLLAACDSGTISSRIPPTAPAESKPADAAKPTEAARPADVTKPSGSPIAVKPAQTASPAAKPTSAASQPVAEKPTTPPLMAASPAQGRTTTGPLGAGTRISWLGQSWFFNGANVPWLNWARDFGGGPKDGVSNPDNRKKLNDAFAMAKANGVNVIRWWTFEGDAWQIKRDGSGAPTELDQAVFADFDAALDLADKHDLYYVFDLFSAPQHIPASWMENPNHRSRLASALSVLFATYRKHPRVMTWEVFNEPEFDVWQKRVKEEPMKATIKEIAAAVHANSHAYVTTGGAMLDGLPMLKGLGLDYYQAHWYDYMEAGNWCALCTNYDEVQRKHNLDAPLVIGEIYLSPELENPHLRLEDFYSKGYAGVWPWSLIPEATQDKYAIDWNSMRIFAGRHPDFGPRLNTALPPSEGSPTPRLAFRSEARVDNPRVSPGQKLPIDVKVTGTVGINALVAAQVYHSSGKEGPKQEWDNQAFRPGETKAYTLIWNVPADALAGEYVVKVGVFRPGWGQGGKPYDWNDTAATFTVTR
ncbi:MAG: cellulase family glycosylhydrolase [Chloroflexota bacterium]